MGITDDPFHPVQAAILELAQEPPLSGYLLLAYVNGLAIHGAINAPVVIDSDSVIVLHGQPALGRTPSAFDRRNAISRLTALRSPTTRTKVEAATPRFSASDLIDQEGVRL